jgi:uncharacterized protein
MQVLCDTSFLMVLVAKPLKQVNRVESQLGRIDIIVPDIVIDELDRLEKKAGPKRSMTAKTAAELCRTRFAIVSLPKRASVDDAIIDYAVKNKCAVATIDVNLRKRLISNDVLVLTLSRDRFFIANPSSDDHL